MPAASYGRVAILRLLEWLGVDPHLSDAEWEYLFEHLQASGEELTRSQVAELVRLCDPRVDDAAVGEFLAS